MAVLTTLPSLSTQARRCQPGLGRAAGQPSKRHMPAGEEAPALVVQRVWDAVFGEGVAVDQTATFAGLTPSGTACTCDAIALSLARAGLLRPSASGLTSIEFGCGVAADLSEHVRRLTAEAGGTELRQLLVDRKPEPGSAARHQRVAAAGDAIEPEGVFERLTVDIGDLDLPAVLRSADGTASPVIGMAKHLCGEGTDLALQAMASVVAGRDRSVSVALMGCCHGTCRWNSYANREFFSNHATTIDGEQTFECICAVAGTSSVVYREVTAAATAAAAEVAAVIGEDNTEAVAAQAERIAAVVIADMIRVVAAASDPSAATATMSAALDYDAGGGGQGQVAEIADGAARAAAGSHVGSLRVALQATRLLEEGRRRYLLALGFQDATLLSELVPHEVTVDSTLLLARRPAACC